MKKILLVIDYYLPGYKAGGPVRSIANLVEQLGDEFQFSILTSDRDLGDSQPYPNIKSGSWHPVGKAQVLYLTPSQKRLWTWRQILNQLDYDLLYLNSYFSRLSIKTLWLRKLGLLPCRPLVLAPRGEFSPGALALKAWKKWPYRALSQLLSLEGNLVWHASTPYERDDIQKATLRHVAIFTSRPLIYVARDLTTPDGSPFPAQTKTAGELRVVFVSRLSRKKNLDAALRLLQGVRGQITFDIYGPLEDLNYWRECEALITELPAQVQVHYQGALAPEQVPQVFAQAHLFLFPTRGENFGHVIAEALAAGCPVLLSDQTPWRGLEEKGIGWDISLAEPERFQAVLNRCVAMEQAEFESWSRRARQYMQDWIKEQQEVTLQDYRHLFNAVIQHQK